MAKITDILRDMLNEKQADPKEVLENQIQVIVDQLAEEDISEEDKEALSEKLTELETQLAEEFPPKKDDDKEDDEDDEEKVDEKEKVVKAPPVKKDDVEDDEEKKLGEEEDDEDKMDEASLVPHVDAIKNLFKDQELSEETVEKLGTLFQAAVSTLVAEKVEAIQEELASAAADELSEAIAEIDEKINTYTTWVAEEYMKENEIAIDQGIKTELVESFLSGMKDLFNEHYVDIPEDKVDIIAELGAKLEESDEKLNVLIEENIANKVIINDYKKTAVLNALSEELADTDKEKLAKLTEDIEFKDEASFTVSVKTLKENYLFGNKDDKSSVINEEIKVPKTRVSEMDLYLKAVSNPVFK